MSLVTGGIDVGGTKILSVAVDDRGSCVFEERTPSLDVFESLVETLSALLEHLVSHGASAVGIGIAGMVDREGTIVYSPNLPALRHAPLEATLAASSPVPVVVDNDANTAGLAEACIGVATDASHVLMVTLGTGIGGAWIVDRAIQRGAHGFLGELGHFTVMADGPPCACGARGHWETVASGSALSAQAQQLVREGRGAAIAERAAGAPATPIHVASAARDGDAEAGALVDRFSRDVALGLAGLTNIFDPSVVVVGGGLVELGEVLMAPLARYFVEHLEGAGLRPPVPIRAASFGERANAIGAALLARDAAGSR